jgi:replicative DNA helicase
VVITKYDERRLLEFAEQTKNLVYSNAGSDISSLRNKLEEKLISLSGQVSNTSSPLSATIPELDARIEKYITNPDGITGFKTGLKKLDTTLDGLQKGNVSIVYAPSSRFKSLFATNIGWHLAEQNIPGLWFTTEMPRVQVLERLLQIEAGINLKWLRRDKKLLLYRGRIKDSQERLMKYPIYFCDTSALDVSDIRSEISRQKRWHDIQYIIVDLVDHVSSSKFKDEMVNNQRAVMAAMKQMAKDFDIHVLLVSHVTKGTAETRAKADLDVEEMIGSSAKYQDVDASISIGPAKVDEKGRWVAMSREDILWAIGNGGDIDVLLSVTKNRHGELLRYIVSLDFSHGGRFTENLFKPVQVENDQLTMDE